MDKVFFNCCLLLSSILYLYMIILPIFIKFLLFQHKLHYLIFILHPLFIVGFCLSYSYETQYINMIFFCFTSISLFILPIFNILYLSYLSSLLFDKYYHYIYQSQDIGFICYYLRQVLVIFAQSTIFLLYSFIFFNISLQLFFDFSYIIYKIKSLYNIFITLSYYFDDRKLVYIIIYYWIEHFNIVI